LNTFVQKLDTVNICQLSTPALHWPTKLLNTSFGQTRGLPLRTPRVLPPALRATSLREGGFADQRSEIRDNGTEKPVGADLVSALVLLPRSGADSTSYQAFCPLLKRGGSRNAADGGLLFTHLHNSEENLQNYEDFLHLNECKNVEGWFVLLFIGSVG